MSEATLNNEPEAASEFTDYRIATPAYLYVTIRERTEAAARLKMARLIEEADGANDLNEDSLDYAAEAAGIIKSGEYNSVHPRFYLQISDASHDFSTEELAARVFIEDKDPVADGDQDEESGWLIDSPEATTDGG